MVSFFGKAKLKTGKRTNRKDGRGWALEDAGMRLLARNDYDQVSIAQIAREAGCSVGAFYGRYRDKQTYLYFLVASGFRTLTQCAQNDLGETPGRKISTESIAGRIVDHVVSRMTAGKVAGIVRATMKLATIDPPAIEPFEDYREAVAKRAIALLTQTSNRSTPRQIGTAVQIVIATVTDAILQKKPGPLVVGTPRLNEALHAVLAGYLGLGKRSGWVGNDGGEDNPVAATRGTEKPPSLPEGHRALFDPDMRAFQGTTLPRTVRTGNVAVENDGPSKAQLKTSAGRNPKKAEAAPQKTNFVNPPRAPSSPISNTIKKRKKPRRKIV